MEPERHIHLDDGDDDDKVIDATTEDVCESNEEECTTAGEYMMEKLMNLLRFLACDVYGSPEHSKHKAYLESVQKKAMTHGIDKIIVFSAPLLKEAFPGFDCSSEEIRLAAMAMEPLINRITESSGLRFDSMDFTDDQLFKVYRYMCLFCTILFGAKDK